MGRITPLRYRIRSGRRKLQYLLHKATGFGVDKEFERNLKHDARNYVLRGLPCPGSGKVYRTMQLSDLELENTERYSIFRKEKYGRFVTNDTGSDRDYFGRKGSWVSRGCQFYYDELLRDYIKTFDEYYCHRGEGRFFRDALDSGFFDFLCPKLSYVILDDSGSIRGYAIQQGKPLTRYEFERYVSGCLKEAICAITQHTGLYFRDLTFQNVIVDRGSLSLIDIDSVLPVDWFGQSDEFSLLHLSEIDVGWPMQRTWNSPLWYWKFLKDLTGREYPPLPTTVEPLNLLTSSH